MLKCDLDTLIFCDYGHSNHILKKHPVCILYKRTYTYMLPSKLINNLSIWTEFLDCDILYRLQVSTAININH